ncbi:ABC transporter permease [Sphingobium sp. BS19]|uniref:ABC transporter permease n=1 Tax=Sphingobium sp. BS19 TaxID=3018973 RepID=UPI002492DFF6|nr:ABC transporter permease [Sphingobium sp. BS19]|tara:strand:- start:3487 stop:4566 length:1080 start_codon:yes stop_codon:yes gene_type:complete
MVKEFWAVLRDPRSRISLIVPPLIQLLVFGYASTLEVKNVTIGIFDQDGGRWSQEIIQRLAGSPNIERIVYFQSGGQLARALDTQQVIAAVRFEQNFSGNVISKRGAVVGAIFDGRKSNSAQIVSGYINDIVDQASLDSSTDANEVKGRSIVSYWYNSNLDYIWFTIPGLVVIISLVSCTSVVSQSVARERELGTYDQILVSPVRLWELMAGKMAIPVIIGLANATLYLIANPIIFGVPFRGSLLLFFCSLLIFLLAMTGTGMAISVAARTQQQAFLGMFAISVPVFLLSGYAAPIDNIPPILQTVAEANPAKHFLIVAEGLFLKDMPAIDVFTNSWPMAVIAFVTICASFYMFRIRID